MPRTAVTLADLADPPDTATLLPLDESATARAIATTRAKLMRRRKALIGQAGAEPDLDRVIASLRRLQNPQLTAYSVSGGVVLSEPFNGIARACPPASPKIARLAADAMVGKRAPAALVRALGAFGDAALGLARAAGVRIRIVAAGIRFSQASASVARCVPGIDEWEAPPSGLFVVEDRTVLLRDRALHMTAAHEFAHALDAALASRPRSYFSFESEELRYYFSTATGYVNEYAASGLDEYFAESIRAYVEVNDPACAWLPLTRQDLFLRDPMMFALVDRLFATGLTARERRLRRR
ncbi:MAG TPA: hypothetical protein VKT51_05835 [Candidatus Eremiobacteraceae bacterium]|nr:hypothetical protein [Candidatus Eremiobacteraceae bacterium]